MFKAEAVGIDTKPILRGWFHAGLLPFALLGGLLLVLWSPTGSGQLGSAIYAVTVGMLLTVSAIYHRGMWTGRTLRMLQRLDHASIFLVIAGTCTPFGLLLLANRGGNGLLWIIWTGGVLGALSRIVWVGAPRWFITPLYILLGWVVVFYLGDIYALGGGWVVTMLLLGGAFYSVGALVYAARRPNPWPRWFGHHEIFHACTIAGFSSHYIAISAFTWAALP